MPTNWRLGLGFSLITALMWGGLPISLKAIVGDMDSATITWYRFSLSAFIALLWYGHRSGPALKRLLSRPLWPMTLLAVSGLLLNYLLYLVGLDYTTAAAAQILIQIAPLLLLLGSVFLFKEKFSPLQWLGVGTFSSGLLLFFHHRMTALASTGDSYVLGLALIALAAISWAVYGLAQKQLLKSVSTNDLLLLIYLSGTLCFLPAASPASIVNLDGLGLVMLLFASLNTIIAYGCFGLAMTHWEASRVSASITTAPLFTLLFVFIINTFYPDFIETEPLDWLSRLGALLVVTGSIGAALGNRR